MYESEAYEILHIKRGSSQEEIKEAYAALSKKYHPEEHPDEFQQIHEAYMTLRRRSRGQRSERRNPEQEPKTMEAEDASVGEAAEKVTPKSNHQGTFSEEELEGTEQNTNTSEKSTDSTEAEAQGEYQEVTEDYGIEDYAEKNAENQTVWESQSESAQQDPALQYDFDEVIEENERKDEQRLILLIQKALVEMEMLLKPPYCNKLKLFQQFFQKPEYQTALKQPAFMAYFADMLTDSHLKPMIYDHIIEYYRFRGLNPADMYEEAAKLYYVLDDKRGMKKKRAGFWQGVLPVAAIAGIRAGTRSAKPGTGAGNLFGFLFVVFRTVCTGDGCVIVDDFSVCHTDGRFLCSTDGIRWGNGTCSIPFPDGNYLDHRCRNRCDHQKNEQFQEKKIRKIYRSCRKNVISCKWHFFLYILL